MSILSTEFRDETLEITDDCKKNRDILNGVLGERSILNTCFGIWVFSRHYILFRGHYKKIFRFGLNSYLRDKIVILFCPKLDSDVEGYVTKLAEIFSQHAIRSITVLHMEVPCCSGVRYVVDQALKRSGKEIPVKEHTILISGGSRRRGKKTIGRRGSGMGQGLGPGLTAARHTGSPSGKTGEGGPPPS